MRAGCKILAHLLNRCLDKGMKASNKQDDKFAPKEAHAQIERVDQSRFSKEMDIVIKESEEMRIKRMMQHRTRGFVAMNTSIFFAFLGALGAGYLFLMLGQLFSAIAVLLLSFVPPIFLHIWAGKPIKTYKKEHKTIFMPKLAQTLNGLSFHAERGVSSKIINKLPVIPDHDIYRAEDCFMGEYKGVKVIFSEARLFKKGREVPAFDGIFVLLETKEAVFEGHTIITADHNMVKQYESTRWKNLKKTHISVTNRDWDIFSIFSSKPESAELFIGERLIKELAEAAQIFDNAPLTAVLFGKKHVFMMIPYDKDMFEASSLFVPITTKDQVMRTKREIEQLLEIVDVFDLYEPLKA